MQELRGLSEAGVAQVLRAFVTDEAHASAFEAQLVSLLASVRAWDELRWHSMGGISLLWKWSGRPAAEGEAPEVALQLMDLAHAVRCTHEVAHDEWPTRHDDRDGLLLGIENLLALWPGSRWPRGTTRRSAARHLPVRLTPLEQASSKLGPLVKRNAAETDDVRKPSLASLASDRKGSERRTISSSNEPSMGESLEMASRHTANGLPATQEPQGPPEAAARTRISRGESAQSTTTSNSHTSYSPSNSTIRF